MAIFKAPKVTTAQRNALTLDVSELVYDIDQKAFYGGDGSTQGGFLVGESSGFIVEKIELTQDDINNKYVTLAQTPLVPSAVIIDISGGTSQLNGIDYEIIGNKVSWNELGLDGFLDNTDVLIVQY
jgi:hypothetical protein